MTDPHPTAEALVRTILAAPADPLPRLVFADWLDETDNPANFAWAKYLRLAVDLSHLPLTPPRRLYLQDELDKAAGDIRAGLTIKAEQFAQYADAFGELLPLRCFTLNVDSFRVPPALAGLVPESLAREYSALPVAVGGDRLVVAVADPTDADRLDRLAFGVGRPAAFVRALPAQLPAALDRAYPDGPADQVVSILVDFSQAGPADPLRREAESGPVARVIGMVLHDALADGAAEITLERQGPRVEVRQLVGGERRLWGGLPERLHLPLVARLQLLADLTVGPVAVAQLGTLPHVHAGRLVHLGLRVAPARSGPRVTLTIPTGPAPDPSPSSPPAA